MEYLLCDSRDLSVLFTVVSPVPGMESTLTKWPGVVAHACNPSTWEAETGGSQVGGQPQLPSEALRNLVRPCFKIKNKK